MPITSDLSDFDALFLGSPKWTFGCPPVNEYLHSLTNFRGKKTMVFLTYGGFDYVRYAREMGSAIRRRGMDFSEVLMLPREEVEAQACLPKVEAFCWKYLRTSASARGEGAES